MESPLLTVPGTDVKLPLLIEYSPPVIEIGVMVLIPAIVTTLDVTTVFNATPIRDVNVNGSGVVSAARVVTLKVPFTPPMLKVTVVVVEKEFDEVCRSATVSPLFTVPAEVVKAPPLIEYSHKTLAQTLMEMGAGILIPVIVTVLDVTNVFRATPV
jgi:hypothetical protein